MNHRIRIVPTDQEQWKRLSESGQLYAIVDSCDEPAVHKKVGELGPERAVSLYRGTAEERYSHIAPYLMRVDAAVFEWIAKALWPAPWGIFVYTDSPMDPLRTHFRRFLTVKGTDQKKYLLRFYDPRVLPKFLESCDDDEASQFFGPVRGYGAKKDDAVELLRLQ